MGKNVYFIQGNKEKKNPVGAFTAGILSLWLCISNLNIPLNPTYNTWKLCSNARLVLGTSDTDSIGKAF